MTPKEKIYAKIIATQNEERKILGLVPMDIERILTAGYARHHTIKELEEDLVIAQKSLANTKKKADIEAYFKTPTGAALKNKLEKKIDTANGMLLKAHADMAIDLRDFTVRYLGYRWIIRSFNDRCLSIEFTDRGGQPVFGMRIEVYYGVDLGDPDTFTMSYTSGSDFNPTVDNERHEFVTGLCVVTKQEVAMELKKMLKAYSHFCNEYYAEIDELKKRLNNPLYNDL